MTENSPTPVDPTDPDQNPQPATPADPAAAPEHAVAASTNWTPQDAALGIPCARCEAKVDQHCTTISGEPCDPHAARWRPLANAYAAGMADSSRPVSPHPLMRAEDPPIGQNAPGADQPAPVPGDPDYVEPQPEPTEPEEA